MYPSIPYQPRDSDARNSQGEGEDGGPIDEDADQLNTTDSEPSGFLGRQLENAKTLVSTALQNLLSHNVSGCSVLFKTKISFCGVFEKKLSTVLKKFDVLKSC